MKAPVWIQLRDLGGRNFMAQTAWNNIDDYRAMATVQLGRITENNYYDALAKQARTQVLAELDLSPDQRAEIEHMQSARATADAHFYLNCWRIVALNAYRITKAVDSDELARIIHEG